MSAAARVVAFLALLALLALLGSDWRGGRVDSLLRGTVATTGGDGGEVALNDAATAAAAEIAGDADDGSAAVAEDAGDEGGAAAASPSAVAKAGEQGSGGGGGGGGAAAPSAAARGSSTPTASPTAAPTSAAPPPPPAAEEPPPSASEPLPPPENVSPTATPSMTPMPRNASRLVRRAGAGECGYVAPMTGATRCDRGPPYFYPTNCVARAWNATSATACLSGARVFILGNSVGRGAMYELGDVLNGASKAWQWGTDFDARRDRVRQIQACAKAPRTDQSTYAKSCEVTYHPVTTVNFMWRQWFGEPLSYTDTAGEGDFCLGQDWRSCVAAFLAPSQPGDLLIVQLGLAYARYLKLDLTPDVRAYIAGELTAFLDVLASAWKGGVVLAVNTAPLTSAGWPPGANERAALVNAAAGPVWAAAGIPVLDQWAINDGHFDQYEDAVHFPSALPNKCLGAAFWQHVLSMVCPDDTGAWLPPAPSPTTPASTAAAAAPAPGSPQPPPSAPQPSSSSAG